MPKFNVRIKRIDTYSRDLEVEAPSKRQARKDVAAKLADAGWEGAFPDNDDGEYEECESFIDSVERITD